MMGVVRHGNIFSCIPAKISVFCKKIVREHCLKSNFLQLSHNMFCKNVARSAVAVKHSYAPYQTSNIVTEHIENIDTLA